MAILFVVLVLGFVVPSSSVEKFCGFRLEDATLKDFTEFDGSFIAYANDPFRTCFKMDVTFSDDKTYLNVAASNKTYAINYKVTEVKNGIFHYHPLNGEPDRIQGTIFHDKGSICIVTCSDDKTSITRFRCFSKTEQDSPKIKQFLDENLKGKVQYYSVFEGCMKNYD